LLCNHCLGGWVCLEIRASLDMKVERKIKSTAGNRTPILSSRSP
jgi:hypothetical protein